MKAKITGNVECLVCGWAGTPKDLIEKDNGTLVECPQCKGILIDFRDGNFNIQNIKADTLTLTD